MIKTCITDAPAKVAHPIINMLIAIITIGFFPTRSAIKPNTGCPIISAKYCVASNTPIIAPCNANSSVTPSRTNCSAPASKPMKKYRPALTGSSHLALFSCLEFKLVQLSNWSGQNVATVFCNCDALFPTHTKCVCRDKCVDLETHIGLKSVI